MDDRIKPVPPEKSSQDITADRGLSGRHQPPGSETYSSDNADQFKRRFSWTAEVAPKQAFYLGVIFVSVTTVPLDLPAMFLFAQVFGGGMVAVLGGRLLLIARVVIFFVLPAMLALRASHRAAGTLLFWLIAINFAFNLGIITWIVIETSGSPPL
jgi:hypothetical protein